MKNGAHHGLSLGIDFFFHLLMPFNPGLSYLLVIVLILPLF